jgi:hypothetical protein
MSDSDGRNQIPSFYTSSSIDTYNLTNPDLTTNRSLRVYVGGKEIAYDSTKKNGYTFSNGYLRLYGDARPDISANQKIKIDYVYEYYSYNTTTDVYGIKLNSTPEVYNLGSTTSPSSIRVFRNATEEIAYSNEEGFQYNAATNTIELYGKGRPDVVITIPFKWSYLQEIFFTRMGKWKFCSLIDLKRIEHLIHLHFVS